MEIHIKRSGALGDVLLTTPIVRRLRELNPNSTIYFYTECSEIYENNSDVDYILPSNQSPSENLINLDMVYENNPKMHIIDAYSQYVFGKNIKIRETKLVVTNKHKSFVNHIIASRNIIPEKAIICHMAKSWKSRTMPLIKWIYLIEELLKLGFQPIIVGAGGDLEHDNLNIINLKGQLNIHHINYLCSISYAFIGMDSGIFHVAGATPENTCKVFGIFTCAESKYRMPFRKNVFPIETYINCYGCLHRIKPPVTFINCEREDNACVNMINIDKIIDELGVKNDLNILQSEQNTLSIGLVYSGRLQNLMKQWFDVLIKDISFLHNKPELIIINNSNTNVPFVEEYRNYFDKIEIISNNTLLKDINREDLFKILSSSYNKILDTAKGDLIHLREDDIIPEEGSFKKIFDTITDNTKSFKHAVAGVYKNRYLTDIKITNNFEVTNNISPFQIDFTGTGFLILWRESCSKFEIPTFGMKTHDWSWGIKMKEEGKNLWMVPNALCRHYKDNKNFVLPDISNINTVNNYTKLSCSIQSNTLIKKSIR